MLKVYQTVIDPGKGNCMQAAIASLFDKPLDEVPNFIEFRYEWFNIMWEFIKSQGYDYSGTLYNNHTNNIIEEFRFEQIKELEGVNGYFYASVYSPKYYDPNKKDGEQVTHAVIIDKDFNIVHDPNPNNTNIVSYPESEKLGYNGILNIYLMEKLID